jgi:hypothetical protein
LTRKDGDVESLKPTPVSVVYFLEIGKHVKIGVTKDLRRRLKQYATHAIGVEVLATFPGGRKEEQRLHRAFSALRCEPGEFFSRDPCLSCFIECIKSGDIGAAWGWLPDRRAQINAEERRRQISHRRKTKAEEDAYYASLVAERKRRLGWCAP